jgi:hypothetical protein
MRNLFSMIPEDWGDPDKFGEAEKLKWYNENKVTPDELLATGVVSQDTIDTMLGRGYVGTYDAPPAAPIPTAAPAQQTTFQPFVQEDSYDPYAYQDNYSYQDLIADTTSTLAPTPAPTPAPTVAPAAFNPLTFDWANYARSQFTWNFQRTCRL